MNEKMKREIVSWSKSVAIALLLALFIRQFLYTPATVSGQSMLPTFEHEERILISKLYSIDHFDLVVFQSPTSDDHFIKRVIGLPGDYIVMKDDNLYINGILHEETYIQENKARLFEGSRLTDNFEIYVPDNHFFVLGDNRQHSQDSRQLGPIEKQAVVGKVSLRIFPFRSIGFPK